MLVRTAFCFFFLGAAPVFADSFPLVSGDPLACFNRFDSAGAATFSTVAVTGIPFTRAMRLRTEAISPVANACDIRPGCVATLPARKNDISAAPFWVRAIAAADQEIEIGGIASLDFGPGPPSPNSDSPCPYAEPAAAPWRPAAARIDRYRKGDLTVIARTPDGQPVPGAHAHVKMTRHAFGFGTAVAGDVLQNSCADGRYYRDAPKELFNKLKVNPLDAATLNARVDRRIEAVMSYSESELGDDEMSAWLRRARTVDRGAKLYINDNSILEAGGSHLQHSNGYPRIITKLLAAGAPTDGIGLQFHFDSNRTPLSRVFEFLDRFAAFGKDLSPAEIVTIFGAGLGPSAIAVAQYSDGRLPIGIGGTCTLFDGAPAPMTYSAAGQVSTVVPCSVNSTAQVPVEYQGVSTGHVPVPVAPAAPGIFTCPNKPAVALAINTSAGAVLSCNCDFVRPSPGSVVTFFLTGDGVPMPPIAAVRLPAGWPCPAPAAPWSLSVGGTDVPPCAATFAGYASVTQLNVRIPEGVLRASSVPVVFRSGAAPSGAATINLKPLVSPKVSGAPDRLLAHAN